VLKVGIVSTAAGYAALMLAAASTYWGLHAVGAAEADTFLKSDGLKHTIHPDSLVLLIAACGAVAGITMQAAFRRSVIAGALIALRIIETAGVIGIGLAIGRFDLVGQSFGRLAIDMAFIIGVGIIVFGLKQLTVHRRTPLR
jgi:uncharacterized membrane protein